MARRASQMPAVVIRREDGALQVRRLSTWARRWGVRRLLTSKGRVERMAGVVVLAGLLTILVELFTSYAFFVYAADVRGNVLLSASHVYEASQIDTVSIFWIEPEVVERRLEELPYVRSATVRCALPNRVEIAVQERVPVILWRTDQGVYWVDGEGIAMRPLRELPGLVQLEDSRGDAAVDGGNLDPAIAAGIVGVRQLLPETVLFNYNRSYGLQFVTPDRVQVVLGDGQEMAHKIRVFDAVRRRIAEEGRTVHLIDLRYMDEPYVR